MDARENIDPSAPLLLEVADFQHTSFGTERVLLRLDGRYLDRPGRRILEATLFVVDDGLSIHRHASLPEPGGDAAGEDWLWRAAFAVPASYLADARTTFALQAEPGGMLDLPYPVASSLGASARPLSERAAHTARRYAAAVAILVTVAVSPGGLPAAARTEVIKVTKADGTVVYVTSDGRELPQLPEDGVITASQVLPPPAEPQAPAPQPPPAAEPAPAPQPAQKKAKRPATTMLGEDSRAAELTQGVLERRAAPRKKKSRAGEAAKRPLKPRHAGGRPTVTPPASHMTTDGRGPAGGRRHTDDGARQAVPQEAAPTQAAELTSLPQIVTQQVGDDEFVRVERPVTEPRPASSTPRRGRRPATPRTGDTKSLAPLVALTGSDAALQVQTPTAAPLGPLSEAGPQPADWKDAPEVDAPETDGGDAQSPSGGKRKPPKEDHKPRAKKKKHRSGNGGAKVTKPRTPLRNRDGSPTRQNPGFFDALPGPSVQGVPNFVIRKFQVPLFLLPIYQAAGIQYGIRWEVLAAINEIETDYGRNLNVSSAGALGWMQFMPATWRAYGVDANKDKKRDPYNPVDAIFAAARYLKASGGDKDLRKAIFAYNRADWYVDSVLMRAKLIAGVPGDVVGSLTGLTEGRFPVAARARYADDLSEKEATKQVKRGQNAANVVTSDDGRRSIDIFADKGSPVVAVNDGVVKAVGRSKKRGLYLVLQDVYGNRYTYSGLGSVADLYPVPRDDVSARNRDDSVALAANDPKPRAAASAGSHDALGKGRRKAEAKRVAAAPAPQPKITVKERLFAHPDRPKAKAAGGLEQMLDNQKGFETYDNYFVRGLGLNARNATLRRLRKGSRVVASTIIGRVAGSKDGKAANVKFEIRPAGRGAPRIDPKPILDGWKLLESTAIYRANGQNVLYGEDEDGFSIGQIMLLSKPLLEKRVLSDERIDLYPGGRADVRAGQIDRRVLATLAYLAESGMRPTVTSLRTGHGFYTSSGNVSAHSSGNAVDIGAINGIPLVGAQNSGGIGVQAVRRLMQLQGTLNPAQIISLNNFGANTLAMADHDDHIHVGFRPLFGANSKLGRQTLAVLQPGQWDDLLTRLRQIDNPRVSTKPSRYALPVRRHKRASGAHRGE